MSGGKIIFHRPSVFVNEKGNNSNDQKEELDMVQIRKQPNQQERCKICTLPIPCKHTRLPQTSTDNGESSTKLKTTNWQTENGYKENASDDKNTRVDDNDDRNIRVDNDVMGEQSNDMILNVAGENGSKHVSRENEYQALETGEDQRAEAMVEDKDSDDDSESGGFSPLMSNIARIRRNSMNNTSDDNHADRDNDSSVESNPVFSSPVTVTSRGSTYQIY